MKPSVITKLNAHSRSLKPPILQALSEHIPFVLLCGSFCPTCHIPPLPLRTYGDLLSQSRQQGYGPWTQPSDPRLLPAPHGPTLRVDEKWHWKSGLFVAIPSLDRRAEEPLLHPGFSLLCWSECFSTSFPCPYFRFSPHSNKMRSPTSHPKQMELDDALIHVP